jgi:hypothetical protein
MFVLHSPRRALVHGVLVLMLAGCGRELSRSLAPDTESQAGTVDKVGAVIDLASANNAAPIATILSPSPSSVYTQVLQPPVTIEWAGQDSDGHIREYRYRLFQRTNPDFPSQPDFLAFLDSHPDSVLLHYAPGFEGWESVRARKTPDPASVTYPTLEPNEKYAFVVVAIDNRRDHDPMISRGWNILVFVSGPGLPPDLTFTGPFGEVTNPTGSVVVPAGQPVTIHWFATPRPGMAIHGYRWTIGSELPTGEPSLSNTTATISPPTSGDLQLLFVDVTFDQGLRTLQILPLSFTGGSVAALARSNSHRPADANRGHRRDGWD